MKYFTKGWLKSACFSGMLLFALNITGCSTSDDPTGSTMNIPPVAVDDAFTVDKNSTTALDLALNDSDADDGLDLASITIVAAPANGVVTVNADGTVDYAHDDSNSKSDEFSYTIKDNSAALSNVATVTITVTSAPSPVVQAGIYKSTVVEGADDLEFVVSLAEASIAAVSIDYSTANGTAVAGTDYSATSGTLQFAPGEMRKFVSVAVLNNPATASTMTSDQKR